MTVILESTNSFEIICLAKKASYGIDRPDDMIVLALGGCALLVLGLSGILPVALAWVGVAVLVITILFALGDTQKPRTAKAVLDSLNWRGTEAVLDVGCGSGLWMITAAKHLTSGHAVGVDVWSKRLQSGNSPEKALENARLEGVSDRVEVKDGDARSLPFDSGSFDVVVSSLVIHHVPGDEREKALGEIVRVLKHGGVFVMFDLFNWTTQSSRLLRGLGMTEIHVSWGGASVFSGIFGTRILRAIKP